MKLLINNEVQKFREPKILKVPIYNEPESKPILWKREIDFPIEDGLSVRGFVAIRDKGSTKEAGFALFRRGRVIEGSFDNGFRPPYIFGAPNSYRYQRVFGELHLEGFDVSFTKKGIQWDENLDIFLQLLKDELSTDRFPLLKQAEEYRVRAKDKDYQKSGVKALENTVKDFEDKAPKAIQETFDNNNKVEEPDEELTITSKAIQKEFEVNFNNTDWKIYIELSYDPSLNEMIKVGKHLIPDSKKNPEARNVGIRLSLTHPFMIQFVGTDNQKIEPILRMSAALGLAELIARESPASSPGEIRRNFNDLITKLSS